MKWIWSKREAKWTVNPRPNRSRLHAIEEALGQSVVDETRRTGIDPFLLEPKIPRDLIPRLTQLKRQWIRLLQDAHFAQSNDVNVLCRPFDQPKRDQRRTTDNPQLVMAAGMLKLLG